MLSIPGPAMEAGILRAEKPKNGWRVFMWNLTLSRFLACATSPFYFISSKNCEILPLKALTKGFSTIFVLSSDLLTREVYRNGNGAGYRNMHCDMEEYICALQVANCLRSRPTSKYSQRWLDWGPGNNIRDNEAKHIAFFNHHLNIQRKLNDVQT